MQAPNSPGGDWTRRCRQPDPDRRPGRPDRIPGKNGSNYSAAVVFV